MGCWLGRFMRRRGRLKAVLRSYPYNPKCFTLKASSIYVILKPGEEGEPYMVKKVQDLKPDTVLKNYWNNKEQFTDLFNAVLFQGRAVIRAEELVLHCGNSGEFGTRYFRPLHVCKARRRHRYAVALQTHR